MKKQHLIAIKRIGKYVGKRKKKKFSKNWKASSHPRKQRKYLANAPLHIKKKFISANLSKELRKKLGKRNIIIKKGDKVKIFRGKFKGKEGKVLEIHLKKSKIIVENIQVKKMDGSKANVKMHPSNLQIIELVERKNKPEQKNIKRNEKIKEERGK